MDDCYHTFQVENEALTKRNEVLMNPKVSAKSKVVLPTQAALFVLFASEKNRYMTRIQVQCILNPPSVI